MAAAFHAGAAQGPFPSDAHQGALPAGTAYSTQAGRGQPHAPLGRSRSPWRGGFPDPRAGAGNQAPSWYGHTIQVGVDDPNAV